jgi:hypothetical protein
MERELGEGRGRKRLEDLRDSSVEADAAARKQFVVERLADEIVRESIAHRASGHREEQALFDAGIEEVDEVLALELTHTAQQIDAELGPENRPDLQGADDHIREVLDPLRNDRADPSRHRHAQRRQVSRVGSRAAPREQP